MPIILGSSVYWFSFVDRMMSTIWWCTKQCALVWRCNGAPCTRCFCCPNLLGDSCGFASLTQVQYYSFAEVLHEAVWLCCQKGNAPYWKCNLGVNRATLFYAKRTIWRYNMWKRPRNFSPPCRWGGHLRPLHKQHPTWEHFSKPGFRFSKVFQFQNLALLPLFLFILS